MPLILEAGREGKWIKIFEREPSPGFGSLSSIASGRREIIMFDTGQRSSTIWRSRAGVDIDLTEVTREVLSVGGYEVLAELSPGEQYEFTLQTERMQAPVSARFRQA